ncbi:hypothetical protein NQ317_011866 [Molorchus minor]|uniref:Uncharacterized protein n=1 Tax=Molorchus minor TaxID=1323400 RepID=A0ABQ9IZS5_9CUCU|nr:hypothetical protein NQ317_011866 [Molorchus minor]
MGYRIPMSGYLIRHHSFIPAHIHHVYVPVILARSVIVKPLENYYYDFYPKPLEDMELVHLVVVRDLDMGFK